MLILDKLAITVHNRSGGIVSLVLATSGSSLQGQNASSFQANVNTTAGTIPTIPDKVIRTFMFLGSTAIPRWIVLGC